MDGGCVPPMCPSGLTDCAGECVDTEHDPANCGGCGVVCGASEACSAGRCRALRGFSGETGDTWEAVGSLGRGLQDFVPAGEAFMYYGSGTTFARLDIAAGTTGALTSSPRGLAGWGSPTLSGGFIWEIVPPYIVRYDVAAGTWSEVRADVMGASTSAMTVADDDGNLWGYTRSPERLVRYEIATDTLTYFPTGVSAGTQTRLGYDATTHSVYFSGAFNPGFYRFDIATEAITTLTPHPEGRVSDTFCADRSGHIYAAGDCGGPSYFQYDIATDTWSPIPDSPLGGCNGSCSVHEDGWLYTEDFGDTHRLRLF